MTSKVHLNPVFVAPVEQNGIISGSAIDVPCLMNNLTRTLVVQPATNVSSQGAQFQASNVSAYVETDFEIAMDFEFTCTGKTYAPHLTNGDVTSTALWSPACGGVDQLILNKLINYVNYNIGNAQFVESDSRINPEYIDIYASQMSLKKMSSLGVEPFNGDNGIVQKRRLLGNGLIPYGELYDATINAATPLRGSTGHTESDTNVPNRTQFKNYRKGYVEVISVSFTSTDPAATNLTSVIDGASILCLNGGGYYYSHFPTGDYVLTQKTVIRIHEYMISPNTSCSAYTKKDYARIYPSLGYPVSLQFQFNQQYMQNGAFIIMPPALHESPTITQQPELKASTLKFYTFDCNKRLLDDTMRIYYSKADRVNTPFVTQTWTESRNVLNSYYTTYPLGSGLTNPMTTTVSSPNLKYLPRYIMLFVSTRMWENASYKNCVTSGPWPNTASPYELAPYVLNPLTRVSIMWGNQSDVIFGVNSTIKDLVDLTMDTLQNPEIRDVVANQLKPLQCGSFQNNADNQNHPDLLTLNTDFFERVQSKPRGLINNGIDDRVYGYSVGEQFLILDTTRLNFKPVDKANVPALPMVNMGSIAFRSLTISMDWLPNPDLIRAVNENIPATANLSINYNPFIVLINDRIRSIPLAGSGGVMGDDEVEFDMMTNSKTIMDAINEFNNLNNSKAIGTDQIQFVGGANFFSNIFKKVESALPNVSSGIKALHGLTKGRSGHLGTAHNVLGTASNVLGTLGYGKRHSRY